MAIIGYTVRYYEVNWVPKSLHSSLVVGYKYVIPAFTLPLFISVLVADRNAATQAFVYGDWLRFWGAWSFVGVLWFCPVFSFWDDIKLHYALKAVEPTTSIYTSYPGYLIALILKIGVNVIYLTFSYLDWSGFMSYVD